MRRPLHVIGAPTSAGAHAPGQERAPRSFRAHGLLPALAQRGREVVDRGDTRLQRWVADPSRPDAMNVAKVATAAHETAEKVTMAVADGGDLLVVGGDCTVEIGSVTGFQRALDRVGRPASVGLVYIDLDADLKVPATGEGALYWMGVAHLLDAEGSVEEISALGPHRPILTGADVLLFAQDNLTESERELVELHGIEVVTLAEVHDDPAAAAARAVEWTTGVHDVLLVHVDVDVLRWVDIPIAENSRRRDGLSLDELEVALRVLVESPTWRGLTVCEVDPDHAPDEATAMRRLVDVLARLLG